MKEFDLLVNNIWDESKEKFLDECSKCNMMGIRATECPDCKKQLCESCLKKHKCNIKEK